MESKKINQLATNVNPQTSDLTTIGDPITGQLKKITWLQVAHLIGAQASVTLQQVTDNGNTTTDPITTGGLTLTNIGTGVVRSTNGEVVGTYGYGLANGVATLDSGGKIPAAQLPSSVMEYKGTWNASTNTPTLADGTGDNGDVYLVNVAGSQNLGSGTISFAVGDWVVYNGTIWQKSLNSNAVASVFGRTGTITAQEGDYNIDQLGDVAITSAAANDYLRYTGSSWVNTPFPSLLSSDKLVLAVRNNSGATINKGTVVYINGATAGYPTIAKALATGDATSAQTMGVVQDNISNNANGYVVAFGQITGIDTSAYAAGTQLYLSSTTAGAFTSTKQYAPNHLVYVGVVTASNAVNGVIEVRVQNGFELDEIHDVSAQNPSNNDGIFYNSTTELWEKKSIATVLGYTPEQPLTFSSPLVRSTNTISIPAATGSVNGYLTSTDWTTFNNKLSAAIISLNGLTAATQTFATGSSGTDFNISSTTSTHTFNIPSASATNRGLVTTGTQTFAGDKTFNGIISGTTAAFSGALAGYGLSVTNIEDSSQGLLVRSTDADTTLYLARFQSSASAVSTTWVDRFSIAKNGSTVIGDNIPAVNIRLWVKGEDQTASNYALDVTDSVGGSIAWFRNDKAIRFYGDLTGVGASFSGNISAANLSGTNTGDQTLSGLGGVPTTRTITINGTSFDLSADRTYSVGTIGGSGTSGYVSKFTGSTTIGNSLIYDSGVRAISIGNSSTNSWASPFYVIEGGTYGQFIGFQTNNPAFKLGTNAYFNGSNYIYTNTGYGVSILDIGSDPTNAYLDFYGAPTGTAGNVATISKKFSIDNTGNAYFVESLGVGFTSGTINGRIDFRNAGNAIIVGKNTTGGTNTYSSIRLTTANSGGVGDSIGEIRGISTNVNNRDIALTFLTTEGSGSQTEKMRITASGNVGIGTSPSEIFHVYTSSKTVTSRNGVNLQTSDAAAADIGLPLMWSSNGSISNYATASIAGRRESATSTNYSGYLQFATCDSAGSLTEKMRITSGGNVGIGVTPSAWFTGGAYKVLQLGPGLSLDSGNDYRARIAANAYVNTSGDWTYTNTGYASIYTQYQGNHIFESAASGTSGNTFTFSERMRITSGGNVGIGSTNPTFRLQVSSGASGNIANISDGVAQTLILKTDANSFILDNSNAGNIAFQSGGSEKMRITSGGNIAINNTTAVSTSLVGALTIWKTYGADGASVPSPTAQNYYNNQDGLYLFGRNSGLSIISANGEEGAIHFANASTIAYATIGTTSGTSSVGGDMYFKVGSNATRMTITSGGQIFLYNLSASAGTNAARYSTATGQLTYDTSSARYKDNIRDSGYGLSDVLKLKSRMFEYKEDNRTDIGLIAEEVISHIPELVGLDKSGQADSISYDRFVSVLVKAIQELKAELDTLKNK